MKCKIHLLFLLFLIILSGCVKTPKDYPEDIPLQIPLHLDIDPTAYEQLEGKDYYRQGDLIIAHMSDIHHFAPELYDADSESFKRFALNSDGRTVLHTTELMESLKADLVARRVDILLLSGDLSVLGGVETHRDMNRILTDFEEAGISVFVTTGNHDVNNPNALLIESNYLTAEGFRDLYAGFGFDQAVMAHSDSLSYLAPLDDNYYLLALDSSYYQNNIIMDHAAAAGNFVPSLHGWVKEVMERVNGEGRQVIVMSHHNFLHHYEIDWDLSNFMISGGDPVRNLLIKEGVNLALSGHIHKGDVKRHGDSDFYGICTSAFSVYPHSYRLLGLSRRGAAISTVNLPLNYGEERNREILNYNWFISYKRTFLGQYERLAKSHSPEDARAMAEYFYLVNLYAQQGLEDRLPQEILESPGASLFEASDSRMKGFAKNLPLDSPPEDRHLILRW